MRASGSRSHEPKSGVEPKTKSQATVEDLVVSVQSENEGSGSLGRKDNLREGKIFGKERYDGRLEMCVASEWMGQLRNCEAGIKQGKGAT